MSSPAINPDNRVVLFTGQSSSISSHQELTLSSTASKPTPPAFLKEAYSKLNGVDRYESCYLGFSSRVNPRYMEMQNTVITDARTFFVSKDFRLLDQRTQMAYLTTARTWFKSLSEDKRVKKGFDNPQLLMIIEQLKEWGASDQYSLVMRFLVHIGPVALSIDGTHFAYTEICNEEEIVHNNTANGVLDYVNGRWSLVRGQDARNQMDVFRELDKLMRALDHNDEDNALNKLTLEESIQLTALIAQLMTNYRANSDITPHVSCQVFKSLNQIFQEHLIPHLLSKQGEFSSLNSEILNASFPLIQKIVAELSTDKYQGLYSNEKRYAPLAEVEGLIKDFIKINLNQTPLLLTFLDEDTETGMKIYQTGKSTDEKRDLVIVLTGNKGFWDNFTFNSYSFSGTRGTEFNISGNGLVHSQVFTMGRKVKQSLTRLLQNFDNREIKYSNIKFMGYGIDGAVAQLVGFDYKKNADALKKAIDVSVIVFATPRYLDQTACAEIALLKKGFSTINFLMSNDPNMSDWGIASVTGINYDDSFTPIQVPNGLMFAMETTKRDTHPTYMGMLEEAMVMHKAMRKTYVSLKAVQQILTHAKNGTKQTLLLINDNDEKRNHQ